MVIKQTRWATLFIVIALVGAAIFGLSHTVSAQDANGNWTGYYWNNATFSGSPTLVRFDANIAFNWVHDSPGPGIPGDNFSVRWYNKYNCTPGTYRFRGGADDGIKVAVDNVIVIDRWTNNSGGFQEATVDVNLSNGVHDIIVDFRELTGEAGVLVEITPTSGGSCTRGFTAPPGAATGTPGTNVPFGATATPLPPPVRAVVIADIVNVRSAPSTDSDIVQIVYLNDDFKVVAQNGFNTWFLIDLGGGRTGWVWRQGLIYLYNGDHTKLPVVTVAVQPAPGPQSVEAFARYMIFVRSLPSTRNSEKLGVINAGSYFRVVKRYSRNRAWVFVQTDDGLEGWVFVPNIRVVTGSIGLLPIGN